MASDTETLASPLTTFTTAVNFVLGAGVLGLPFAVMQAGMAASVATLIIVGCVSVLTSSWLLEVGDRANAVQNELSAMPSAERIVVQHAHGGASVLPPVSDFCKPTNLSEPLLQRTQQKLDEYRAAYRSWRTGSHQGASDTQQRKLMPYLPYQPEVYRKLLPLQLLPAALTSKYDLPAATPEDSTLADEPSLLAQVASGLSSGMASSAGSTHSLPMLSGGLSGGGSGGAGLLTRGLREPSAAAAPGALYRQKSFSADLAAALLQLPESYSDEDEEAAEGEDDAKVEGVATPPEAPEVDCRLMPPVAAYTPPASGFAARGRAGSASLPRSALPDTSLSSAAHSSPRKPASRSSPRREIAPSAFRPDWSVPEAISALEVTQLCTLFLGWRARSAWIASICALHISAMWACCAIWVTSAAAALGPSSPQWLSESNALLLACTAVFLPMSTLGGTEAVQPPLAAATLGTLSLMVVLLGCGLWQRVAADAASVARPPLFDIPEPAYGADDWLRTSVLDTSHFGQSFATFLFAFIVQQSVPSLVRGAAVPAATRSALLAAIATCCSLYLGLGCFAAALFGPRTAKLITLNFDDFTGGTWPAPLGGAPATTRPLWASLIARWVMLLPLLTTTAAFPLFNRVLAANLEALLPTRLRSRRMAATLCALPPLLCTACVRDTALVFSLCGLCGFTIVFFVPAALQCASVRASVRRWGEAGRVTPHTTPFSGMAAVYAVGAFGAVAFVYDCWIVLIQPVLGM